MDPALWSAVIFLSVVLLPSSSSSEGGLNQLQLVQDVKQPLGVILGELEGGEGHRLRADVNPGCGLPECSSGRVTVANVTVAHSPGHDNNPDDPRQHHWLWAVVGRPTIQAALTQGDNDARVDWGRLMVGSDIDGSIEFASKPDFAAAVMFSAITECDVSNEHNSHNSTAPSFSSSSSSCVYFPLERLSWRRTGLEKTSSRAAIAFVGENYTAPNETTFHQGHRVANLTSGKLNLTFSAYSGFGYGMWLPHLSHSESTNQFDIQLDGIETDSGFNHSRFSLEFYLASDAADKLSDPVQQSTKTLDDEHTPGIFITQELVIPGYNSTLQSYLQWRPVVYTTRERDLTHITTVNVSSIESISPGPPSSELSGTILAAMFGRDLDEMLVRRVLIALGQKGDGGYTKTKYQAWTFTMGTGIPIHNGISPFVLLAFTALLGAMVIVSVTAAVLHLVRKINTAKRKQQEQQQHRQQQQQPPRLRAYVRLRDE